MKKNIINIGLDIMLLIVEIRLFLLGRSLLEKSDSINFKLDTFNDIINILFSGKLYSAENLRLWFIAAFILYLFIFIRLYKSIMKESSNYRSLKLYRYGKIRYIRYCKKKTVIANIQSILILVIGIGVIQILLFNQGINISYNNAQTMNFVAQFLKIFITMEIFGSLNIYFLLRNDNVYVIIYLVVTLFIYFILDTYVDFININYYVSIMQKILYLIVYELINMLIYCWCVNATKKKSMC